MPLMWQIISQKNCGSCSMTPKIKINNSLAFSSYINIRHTSSRFMTYAALSDNWIESRSLVSQLFWKYQFLYVSLFIMWNCRTDLLSNYHSGFWERVTLPGTSCTRTWQEQSLADCELLIPYCWSKACVTWKRGALIWRDLEPHFML